MNEANLTDTLLHSFPLLLPEVALVVFACVLFLGGTLWANRHLWSVVSLLALAVAAVLVPLTYPAEPLNAFVSPVLHDGLGSYLRWATLGSGLILLLFSWNEVGDRQAADYYGCLLIVLAGLSAVGFANDLVTLFLALELVSIPTYIMLYLPKHDDAAQEAALKYFMLSIFSSALLLFGFSYLYGLAGSTNLTVILHTLLGADNPNGLPVMASVAVIMILGGLGFRMTAVPFHFYAPDVYEGTATVMAAFLAFIPKATGFIALLRVFGFVLPAGLGHPDAAIGLALSTQVPILLWFLAAITMFLGNFLALLQDNVKRMLAYSSVAHAGYMLVGLAAAPYLREQNNGIDGVEAVLYYLISYGVMTIGAFAVLAYLHSQQRPVENVDDLAGLSRTHPFVALLMVVFLFSLTGIPFTAGFTGKLLVFFGAVGVTDPNYVTLFRVLALLGVINAAIGAWYYLRIIAVMYLRTAVQPAQRPGTISGMATIVLCAILTIGLSFPPGVTWLLRAAEAASGRTVSPQQPQARAER